ncbi:hypothetical protein SMICM17S_07155 [Streptomyces microflavus]
MSRCVSPPVSETATRPAPECFTTLVNASCTIRYAVDPDDRRVGSTRRRPAQNHPYATGLDPRHQLGQLVQAGRGR